MRPSQWPIAASLLFYHASSLQHLREMLYNSLTQVKGYNPLLPTRRHKIPSQLLFQKGWEDVRDRSKILIVWSNIKFERVAMNLEPPVPVSLCKNSKSQLYSYNKAFTFPTEKVNLLLAWWLIRFSLLSTETYKEFYV